MSDSEYDESSRKVGLARLAKARSLSCDIQKVGNESDFGNMNMQETPPIVLKDSVDVVSNETYSPSDEASISDGSEKRSFLKSLHRKSFRKKKAKDCDSTSANSTSCNHLQVPSRTRSKSLSRLSGALSSVYNLSVSSTQCSQVDADNDNLNRPASWYGFDQNPMATVDSSASVSSDEEMNFQRAEKNASLYRQRSFSLNRLNEDLGVSPLSSVKSASMKQKSYLFGGLDSLLGTTELERYFPDRNVCIFIATWNMNGNEPPGELEDFLLPDDMEHMPDIYVVGTQESDDDRTEWDVRLQTTIGPSHVLFTSATLGILHLVIFLRRDLIWFCSVPEEESYSLRPGTYFKTKGAVALSFQFFGTKMLFINTHLFAHEEKLSQRIQNYKTIIRNLTLPKNLRSHRLNMHKDVTHRFDVVFWLGDLNFRLVGNRYLILDKIQDCKKRRDFIELLEFDQLQQSRNKGEIFHGFDESMIHFAPTFKFDVGTNHYDSSSKQRVPSYTDRILYRSTRDPVKCLKYDSLPLFKTSDHKPVWGLFTFKVRPGKDDVPLAAGLFQRDVYLEALRRRRRLVHQRSSRTCQMQ